MYARVFEGCKAQQKKLKITQIPLTACLQLADAFRDGFDLSVLKLMTLKVMTQLHSIAAPLLRAVPQVEAFREGFNAIFPLESLQYFYEDEIEAMLCGGCSCSMLLFCPFDACQPHGDPQGCARPAR